MAGHGDSDTHGETRRVGPAASHLKASALLEVAPDAMVIVDDRGRIVLVNAQTETMFGYNRDELIGQPVEILVPKRYRDGHAKHRVRFFAESAVRPMGSGLELSGRRKDDSEFPIEISLSPLATQGVRLVSSAIRDISERKKADELRFQLAAIVDSSDDAIIGMAPDGTVRSWNGGACRVYGFSAQEMLGRPISSLWPPLFSGEEPSLLRRLEQGERVDPFETIRRRKDGRDIDVSVSISPILDSRGQLVGVSQVARDITDQKRAQEALARAKKEAETASHEFEAFSYSVAHDLRAPLRGIDGFSQALLEFHADQLDEQGQHYLHKVRRSAQRMAQLIESLLALARVTQSDVRRAGVDLTYLASGIANRLRTLHPERNVEVVIAPGLRAHGDPRLLEIVFENLLSNAWKFTTKTAAPQIEVGQANIQQQRVFFIRDNGVGFDMAHSAKLFGVFERLHTVHEFEGVGIGLATVQRIIRRHGGRIWAEGRVDHGATFYFTLAERSADERAGHPAGGRQFQR